MLPNGFIIGYSSIIVLGIVYIILISIVLISRGGIND